MSMSSAVHRTFAIPELLEDILVMLVDDLWSISNQEDPRSFKTYANSQTLVQLLHCSEVCHIWRACIAGSTRLQRVLFLADDNTVNRSWDGVPNDSSSDCTSSGYYPTLFPPRPPMLNPILQTTFPGYQFRFWHLPLEVTNNRYCAYMIINRHDVHHLQDRLRTGQGRTISKMLLSQPPCIELEATIWEEVDEVEDSVDRTSVLIDPIVRCETGLTVGMVHQRVQQMFKEHWDVSTIKLTTT